MARRRALIRSRRFLFPALVDCVSSQQRRARPPRIAARRACRTESLARNYARNYARNSPIGAVEALGGVSGPSLLRATRPRTRPAVRTNRPSPEYARSESVFRVIV
eukprot:580181-Prymnesium_polylepis.1